MNILDKKALKNKVPYTPQHIQRLENEGKFPGRLKLGPNRVGWLEEEVLTWINQRIKERNLGLPPLSLGNWGRPKI